MAGNPEEMNIPLHKVCPSFSNEEDGNKRDQLSRKDARFSKVSVEQKDGWLSVDQGAMPMGAGENEGRTPGREKYQGRGCPEVGKPKEKSEVLKLRNRNCLK